MGRIRKAVTVAVGVGLGWAGTVVESQPHRITAGEWLLLAIGAATALGVYGVPNDPPGPWQPPVR